MSYWISTQQGEVISCTTVKCVTHLESQTLDNKEVFHFFDATIARSFNEEIVDTKGTKPNPESWDEIIADDQEFADEIQRIINEKDVPEANDNYNSYIIRYL